MTDKNTISISLPYEYIRLIDIASKDDDLSRAQLIRRIIKEHISAKDYARKYPVPAIAIEEKPKQIANKKLTNASETNCKSCGDYVHMRREQFKNNGELCQICKDKTFNNDD